MVKGETLISGLVTMEPPQYSDLPNRYYQTHARGRVWARTWRTVTAAIPLEASVKTYTGEEKTRWSLNLFGQGVEIFGNSSISWAFYDTITAVHSVALPGGTVLPVSIRRETMRACQQNAVAVDRKAAQQMLEDYLGTYLRKLVGEDASVEAIQFSARVDDGLLRVTALAECREEIGTEIPGGTPIPESQIPGDSP